MQTFFTNLRMVLLFLWSIFALPANTQARIVRIVFEKIPAAQVQTLGRMSQIPDSYEAWRGKAYGELDPNDPHNALIQDIHLAPLNPKGKVEYAATFTLLKPIETARSSHLLVFEVVNRGASIVPRDYSLGDIFLQSGWQGDIPFGGKSAYGTEAETVLVPTAHNADGTPVTGPVLARFADMRPGLNTLSIRAAVGYSSSGAAPLPVTLDTKQAKLTTHAYEDTRGVVGGVQELASTEWAWADCTKTPYPGDPDPTKVCIKNGFDPNLLYQLQYTGKDPLVLGVGLAALRDVASFFRYAEHDESGSANPVAGQVQFVIARGASQSGNVIRTFLNLGFNQDETGRRVWDGAMPTIAARQNPVNFRFAIPGGASNLYEPGSDGTLWWSNWPDTTRHNLPSSLLDRCRLSQTCPKVMEVMGSTEFYALRASPDFVGSAANKDIPLPIGVRRYYVPSTQHGGGSGGFHWRPQNLPVVQLPSTQNPIVSEPCVLPSNPNPMNEIVRALFVRFRQWVMEGKEPPPSKYPTLREGTLARQAELARAFPFIPGVPSPANISNPTLVYDFGSQFQRNDLSGIITQEPPQILGVLPTVLPQVDDDGNEVGGISTVQQQAPLGTYLGWNVTASGFFKGRFCSLTGSYVPFAATKKERLRLHDSRLSLEERYRTHEGYVKRVRLATKQMVKAGFLMPDDAQRMLGQAESSDALRVK